MTAILEGYSHQAGAYSPRQPKHLIAMSTVIVHSFGRDTRWTHSLSVYRLSDGKKLKGQNTQSSKGYAQDAIHWRNQTHKSYGIVLDHRILGRTSPLQPWNRGTNTTPAKTPRHSKAYYHKTLERWYARIWHSGKHHSLGGYDPQH